MRFALLLACATLSAQTPTPGRGVNFYSIEKEKAPAGQIAAEYRHQARVLDSPSINAYLDDLGQRLAAQAPATGFTYTSTATFLNNSMGSASYTALLPLVRQRKTQYWGY